MQSLLRTEVLERESEAQRVSSRSEAVELQLDEARQAERSRLHEVRYVEKAEGPQPLHAGST